MRQRSDQVNENARIWRRKLRSVSKRPLHWAVAFYPALYNGTEETTQKLKEFVGRKKIHNMYSDNAKELVKAAYKFGVEHHTSIPGEPKTNSLIERTNQIIVGGTTALLICPVLPRLLRLLVSV